MRQWDKVSRNLVDESLSQVTNCNTIRKIRFRLVTMLRLKKDLVDQ